MAVDYVLEELMGKLGEFAMAAGGQHTAQSGIWRQLAGCQGCVHMIDVISGELIS